MNNTQQVINPALKIIIEKIKTGQTDIKAALDYSQNPVELANILYKELLLDEKNYLTYFINNQLDCDLFEDVVKKYLDIIPAISNAVPLKIKKVSGFFALFSKKEKSEAINHAQIIDLELEKKKAELQISYFEELIKQCYRANNCLALEKILSVKDNPASPLMHFFCEQMGEIKEENVAQFCKILSNHNRFVTDVPTGKRNCILLLNKDHKFENILSFINSIEPIYFKNERFLKEIKLLKERITDPDREEEHNYFPSGSGDNYIQHIQRLKDQFDAIVESKQLENTGISTEPAKKMGLL